MTETSAVALATDGGDLPLGQDPAYWHSLIPETEAAEFLNMTSRSMQAMRQRGGGPRFIRISSRCIRYRRVDLKTWADARMRSSTSDPGEEAA